MKKPELIPRKFELGPHKYRIKFLKTLARRTGNWGLCTPAKQEILLQLPDKDVSESTIISTFFHELSHALMYEMGEEELYANEKFVDKLGVLLHQFFISAE